ncbi:MAG: hypothetical protein G01um101416_636 [Microgenomates group bacterium Gr01-1014_16]|nr:MAG: hypothetical protein G01um101416_636 [Microgenomates group bacterium Gr01-1014_16]
MRSLAGAFFVNAAIEDVKAAVVSGYLFSGKTCLAQGVIAQSLADAEDNQAQD